MNSLNLGSNAVGIGSIASHAVGSRLTESEFIGNCRVCSGDGKVSLNSATYEAFGKRIKVTGANLGKQRANSKDEDPTGLLNEGLRNRDLDSGAFISPDPAGFVDGPNLYTYVKRNPWTSFDPEGLFLSAIMEKLDTHVFTPVGEALGEAIGGAMSSSTLSNLSNSKVFTATGATLNATKSASMTALNTLSPFDDAVKQALDGNIQGAYSYRDAATGLQYQREQLRRLGAAS